jgi:hypothetical protein
MCSFRIARLAATTSVQAVFVGISSGFAAMVEGSAIPVSLQMMVHDATQMSSGVTTRSRWSQDWLPSACSKRYTIQQFSKVFADLRGEMSRSSCQPIWYEVDNVASKVLYIVEYHLNHLVLATVLGSRK